MSYPRKRRKYFVDKQVQGALLVRLTRYWLLSLAAVACLTILGWMFVSPGLGVLIELRDRLPSLVGGVFVALLASLIILPVVMCDFIRLSNRFVGPMVRLRRTMKAAAAGETVDDIHFRDDDFWQEIADSFNRINDRLRAQGHHDVRSLEYCDEEPECVELTSVG